MRKYAILACLLALAAPAAAAELPPLRENSYINDRLLVAAIGDRIRTECPTISERRAVTRTQAFRLLAYTLNLGYSRAQIDAYLNDPDNRAWMNGRRDAWLAANGAVDGDPDSFCAIGLREIERGTLLGSLMRAD